jgi:hypothetical protein
VSGGWVVVAGEMTEVPVPTLLNHEIVPRCPGCGRGVHPSEQQQLEYVTEHQKFFRRCSGCLNKEK